MNFSDLDGIYSYVFSIERKASLFLISAIIVHSKNFLFLTSVAFDAVQIVPRSGRPDGKLSADSPHSVA